MPARVRTRRQFARLARTSRRGRSGPLAIHYCEAVDSSEEVAAAFAIPTTVGSAVVRNQIRRRLRAALDERSEHLPDGLYLIRCEKLTKDLSYDQLCDHLDRALRAIHESA